MEFDQLRELLIHTRSTRKFDNSKKVEPELLEKLVELTRYCASGRNAQPLRYVAVSSESMCEEIYPCLKWAGYYKDWDGPDPEQRPRAYIIQCLDTHIANDPMCDDGLQLEAISLGMSTLGLAGCIIKAFDKSRINKILDSQNIESRYDPQFILAIGYPAETIRIEDMDGTESCDFKYYRTPDEVHHVPKRPLSELLLRSVK